MPEPTTAIPEHDRRRVMRSAAVLASGRGVGQILGFVRNLIVARLLSPEDFGVAALFAITLSVIEMVGNLSADRMLVQAEDGDDPSFQRAAHFLLLSRGIGGAILIALAGGPAAHLFDIPEAAGAFRLLALVPLFRGLMHLDYVVAQRSLRFGPFVAVETGAQLVVTAAAYPLTMWQGDYVAVLLLVILQAAVATTMSHVCARRPYRVSFERHQLARLFRFGWPLLLNGMLVFLVAHGDRIIVGTGYSLRELAWFSIALTLTMTPTVMLAHVGGSLLLPILSQVRSDAARFVRLSHGCLHLYAFVAALVALPFILAGGTLVEALFGAKYAEAGTIIGWMAALQSLRLVRAGTSLITISQGDTVTPLLANIMRSASLPTAIVIAAAGGGLVWIPVYGVAAELIALDVAAQRLERCHGIERAITLRPIVAAGVVMALGGAIASSDLIAGNIFFAVATTGALGAALAVFFRTLNPEFRRAVTIASLPAIGPNVPPPPAPFPTRGGVA